MLASSILMGSLVIILSNNTLPAFSASVTGKATEDAETGVRQGHIYNAEKEADRSKRDTATKVSGLLLLDEVVEAL